MNFPEVWNFKLKQKAIHLESFISNDTVAEKITSKLPAAKMISILTPETSTIEFDKIINASDYYCCEDFNFSEVLTRNFINGFLKCGSFSCVQTGSTSFDNSFSISSNKLFLRLNKDSVYSVHSVELTSLKHRSDGEFINYEIELLNEKTDFSNVKSELKDLFRDVAVYFLWHPSSNDVCVSSIAKYFSDAGHNIKLCKNKQRTDLQYGLKFPMISLDADINRFAEVSEYIGMVLLGCNIEDNGFSSYELPNECLDVGRGKNIHCKGFIVHHSFCSIVNEARRILQENPSFPWIALSIIFFTDLGSKLFVITKDKINSV